MTERELKELKELFDKIVKETVGEKIKALDIAADRAIAANREKKAKTKPLSIFENGAHFIYHDIEFIRLGREQGGILAMTTKSQGRAMFNEDGGTNYNGSHLDKVVGVWARECKIGAMFTSDDFLDFELDLTADNGDKYYGTCNRCFGVLSTDLRRKYKKEIGYPRETEEWTCTPLSVQSGNESYMRSVNESGCLFSWRVYYPLGFSPACIFKSSVYVSPVDEGK